MKLTRSCDVMTPLAEAAVLACHSPFGGCRQILGKWQGDGRRFPDDVDMRVPQKQRSFRHLENKGEQDNWDAELWDAAHSLEAV